MGLSFHVCAKSAIVDSKWGGLKSTLQPNGGGLTNAGLGENLTHYCNLSAHVPTKRHD